MTYTDASKLEKFAEGDVLLIRTADDLTDPKVQESLETNSAKLAAEIQEHSPDWDPIVMILPVDMDFSRLDRASAKQMYEVLREHFDSDTNRQLRDKLRHAEHQIAELNDTVKELRTDAADSVSGGE